MNIASMLRIAAVLSAVAASTAAHAVYRCGNVYQDTPCDAAGTQMNPGGARSAPTPARSSVPEAAPGSPAPATSPFAAACSRLGKEAQMMVWKREGGATQERQLADWSGAGNREEMAKLLDSVYRKRGTAPEVRAAIEAECIAEKQQAADNAAILRALLPANAGVQGGAPAPSATAAPPPANEAAAAPKPQATAGPSSSCPGWRQDLDSVNAQMRAGGSAATMERLQARRRTLENSMRDGRC